VRETEFEGWNGDELRASEDFMQPNIPVSWKNRESNNNMETNANTNALAKHGPWATVELRGLFDREQNTPIVLNDHDIILGKSSKEK